MNIISSSSTIKQDCISGLFAYLTALPVIIISYLLLLSIYQDKFPLLPLLCISTGCVTLFWSFYNKTPVVFLPNISVISVLVFSMYWGEAASTSQIFLILATAGILMFVFGQFKIGYQIDKSLPPFFSDALLICLGFLLISTGLRLGGLLVSHPVTFSVLGSLTTRAAVVMGTGMFCFFVAWGKSFKWPHLWGMSGILIAGLSLGTIGNELNAAPLSMINLILPDINGSTLGTIISWPGLYYIIILETILIGLAICSLWPGRRNLDQILRTTGCAGVLTAFFGIPGPMPAPEGLGGAIEVESTKRAGIFSACLFIMSGLFLTVIDYAGNGMLVGPDKRVYPIGAALIVILGCKFLTQIKNIKLHQPEQVLVVLSMSAIAITTNSLIIGFGVGLALYIGYSILKQDYGAVNIVSLILTIIFIIKILV